MYSSCMQTYKHYTMHYVYALFVYHITNDNVGIQIYQN